MSRPFKIKLAEVNISFRVNQEKFYKMLNEEIILFVGKKLSAKTRAELLKHIEKVMLDRVSEYTEIKI